ncbi:cysteine hydrolase [Streptomyces sp. P38-E01]|uniref:Cysteine hydrolase n=2 Tax=Streptomyces tardus TaxID=2780544 RepID=A0A949JL25_9ACTN|nr:cysteine hydrolase [Streptomyces tardus]
MINTYDHPDAEALRASVRGALPGIGKLLEQARSANVPVIYVTDNFGRWRSHHGELIEHALRGPHADLVAPVRPDDTSLFVVKARHSIFYQTPLDHLLSELGVADLVLCGQVTEQCVLYSALDAHLRHLQVTVARDCVAHIHPMLAEAALEMMSRNMGATVTSSRSLSFDA